jgi:hypothetical protein
VKVSGLLALLRSRLSDTVGDGSDRLWGDSELIDDYAQNARTRLFGITRGLIVDSTTAADASGVPLCSIPVIAGTALYPVSGKIIQTTRFRLASQTQNLPPLTVAELDRWNSQWQNLPAGNPVAYCTDWQTGSVLLVPAPAADDTANLTNARYPLADLTFRAPDDDLGFREEYHIDLIPGILAKAFSKGAGYIPDVYKPELAAMHEAQFLARAAEIKTETYRRNKGQHTNRVHRGFSSK